MTGFEWTDDELQGIVDEHLVVLFMKGTPEAPQCGFSNRAAQVLNQLGHPYASVDVLSDRRAYPFCLSMVGFSNYAPSIHWC